MFYTGSSNAVADINSSVDSPKVNKMFDVDLFLCFCTFQLKKNIYFRHCKSGFLGWRFGHDDSVLFQNEMISVQDMNNIIADIRVQESWGQYIAGTVFLSTLL